jgi:hypothetical protein
MVREVRPPYVYERSIPCCHGNVYAAFPLALDPYVSKHLRVISAKAYAAGFQVSRFYITVQVLDKDSLATNIEDEPVTNRDYPARCKAVHGVTAPIHRKEVGSPGESLVWDVVKLTDGQLLAKVYSSETSGSIRSIISCVNESAISCGHMTGSAEKRNGDGAQLEVATLPGELTDP